MSKIRFLVKINSSTGIGKAYAANYSRLETATKPYLFLQGDCFATATLNKETDGAFLKSTNRDIQIVMDAPMQLKEKSQKENTKEMFDMEMGKAAKGDTDAMLQVAFFYSIGYGVKRDEEISEEWLMRAAKTGSAKGMHQLGGHYAGKKDWTLAAKWYEAAINAGLPAGHHGLAILYYQGHLGGLQGQPDFAKCIAHAQKGALEGVSECMVLLSACFVRGEGVPRDIIVGYAWSIVSTIWGKDNKRAIKLRDDLEKTIENIQKDAGQELAKRINRAIEDNKFNKKGLSSENLPREAVRLFQD